MRTICIIGARKGSKRLPGKNKLILAGIPLYAHTVNHAINSNVFDEIMLTSNDEFILEDAKQYDGIVIDQRSEEYSDDRSSMYDVGVYLIGKYRDIFNNSEYICFLNPCCPLRNNKHIRQAHDLLKSKPISILGVGEYPFPLSLALKVKDDKISRDWSGLARASEHEKSYFPAGGIAIVNKEFFIANKDIYGDDTIAYKIDFPYYLDIDEEKEFKIAESYLNGKGEC